VRLDATALGVARVAVDGLAHDAAAPFRLDLLPGPHSLSAGGRDLAFTVAADGTLDYDPSLDGALAGRGGRTLTVLAQPAPVPQPPGATLVAVTPAAGTPAPPLSERPLAPSHGRGGRHPHRPQHHRPRRSRHHRPR
jgi:hypothetical protein